MLLLAGVLAGCQTKVYVGSSIVVAWDAASLATSYEVVMEKLPEGGVVLVGETTALEHEVVFAVEGKYRLGVRSVRVIEGEQLYSGYLWSDVEGVPTPWYVAFYMAPQRVERIRIK
jgi:predicted phage tail protein